MKIEKSVYFPLIFNHLSWNPSMTRFASEFGYQAWSTLASIYDATHNQTDLRINSTWLEHRNHHGDGNIQIQNFIKMLIGNQKTGWSKKDAESDFQKYIYLSQLSQSICTGNEAKASFILDGEKIALSK